MRTERVKVFRFFKGGGVEKWRIRTENKDHVHTVVKRCMRKELYDVIGEVVKIGNKIIQRRILECAHGQ